MRLLQIILLVSVIAGAAGLFPVGTQYMRTITHSGVKAMRILLDLRTSLDRVMKQQHNVLFLCKLGKVNSNVDSVNAPCGVIQYQSKRKTTSKVPRIWKVTLPSSANILIKLTFTQFRTLDSMLDCGAEWMIVRHNNVKMKYCGHRLPWTIPIKSNMFTVEYGYDEMLVKSIASNRLSTTLSSALIMATYEIVPRLLPGRRILTLKSSNQELHLTQSISTYWKESNFITHYIVQGPIGSLLANLKHPADGSCYTSKVYDGPDMAAPYYNRTFNHSKGHVISVCVVVKRRQCFKAKPYILAYDLLKTMDELLNSYASMNTRWLFEKYISVDYPQTLQIPRRRCDRWCLYVIDTSPGLFIDIHIRSLHFKGPQLDDCVNRGLAIYHTPPSFTTPEIMLAKLCKNVFVNIGNATEYSYIPDKITTLLNHVVVAWYDYDGGQLSAEIRVTKTSCWGTLATCNPKELKTSISGLLGPSRTYDSRQPTLFPMIYKQDTLQTMTRNVFPRRCTFQGQKNFVHAVQCIQTKGTTVQHLFSPKHQHQCSVFQMLPSSEHDLSDGDNGKECLFGVKRSGHFNQVAETTAGESISTCKKDSPDWGEQYMTALVRPECGYVRVTVERKPQTFAAVNTKNIFRPQPNMPLLVNLYAEFIARPALASSIYTSLHFTELSGISKPVNHETMGSGWATILRKIPKKYHDGNDILSFEKYTGLLRYASKLKVDLVVNTYFCTDVKTIITFTYEPIESSRTAEKTVELINNKLLVQSNFFQWFELPRSGRLEIHDMQLYHSKMISYQQILLSNATFNSTNCSLRFEAEPTVPLSEFLPAFHSRIDMNTSDIFNDHANITDEYYILWRSRDLDDLSWREAEHICQGINGQLPDMTSEEDINLIENLILGSMFDKHSTRETSYLFNPSRVFTRIHVYIGLTYTKSKLQWTSGRPFTVNKLTNDLKYKTAHMQHYSLRQGLNINTTSDLECSSAVWSINDGFKWILIPCDYKQITPIVICQKANKTGDNSEQGHNTMVTYINGDPKRYLWTLNTCEGESFPIRCFQKLGDEGRIKQDIIRMLENGSTCNDDHHVCIEIIEPLKNRVEEKNLVSVKMVNNTLITAHFTCTSSEIAIDGMCYTFNCRQHFFRQSCQIALLAALSPIDGTLTYTQQRCLTHREPDLHSHNSTCGLWQFQCGNGECISISEVLDGEKECTDGSDEEPPENMCRFTGNNTNSTDMACATCHSANCTCAPLFYHCAQGGCVPWQMVCDGKSDCKGGDDERYCIHLTIAHLQSVMSSHATKSLKYKCRLSDKTIDVHQYLDGRPDCPLFADLSDEPLKQRDMLPVMYLAEDEIPRRGAFRRGCSGEAVSCMYLSANGPPCFALNQLCVYDMLPSGHLAACPNGAHLSHCSLADCSGMFKCRRSYCLHLARLCDGARDCPDGEDEEGCGVDGEVGTLQCPGMFRCHGGACVHPGHVCDGVKHCPALGEDEQLCDRPPCPEGCQCTMGAIYCKETSHVILNCRKYKAVIMKNNTLKFSAAMQNARDVSHMILSNNNIEVIIRPTFASAENLAFLDLSGNNLRFVLKEDFRTLDNLRLLNLSHNQISVLIENTFDTIRKIEHMDLSHNNLIAIGYRTFDHLTYLQILNLSYNNLIEVNFDLTYLISLKTIDLYRNDKIRRAYVNWARQGVYGAGVGCSRCVFKTTHTCTCHREPVNGFPLLHRGLTWMVGLYLVIAAIAVILWRLSNRRPMNMRPIASRDVCCFILGAFNLVVDLGTANTTDDHELNIVCMVGAMMQYTSFIVYCIMGVLHVCALQVLTDVRGSRKSKWAIRLGSAVAWVHVFLLCGLAMGIYYVLQGSFPKFGASCSLPLSTPSDLLGKILIGYLLHVHVVCFFLLCLFARRTLANVQDENCGVRSVEENPSPSTSAASSGSGSGSDSSSTDERGAKKGGAYKLLKRKIKNTHLIPHLLTLPLLGFSVANVAGDDFSYKTSAILSVLVLNLPALFSLSKSVNEMGNKTCCSPEVKEKLNTSEEDDWGLGITRTYDQTMLDTGF